MEDEFSEVQLGIMHWMHGSGCASMAAWRAFIGELYDTTLPVFVQSAIEQFASLLEAQVLVGDWRTEYNTYRPHSALDGLTPADYAEQWRQTNQPGSAAISSAPVGRQRDGNI